MYFHDHIPVSDIDRKISIAHHKTYKLNFYIYTNLDRRYEFIVGELDMVDAWEEFVASGNDIFIWRNCYIIPKNYHYITLKAL